MNQAARSPLIAVDVGNSQIKAGLFAEEAGTESGLPQPERTLSLDADQWEPVEIALWLAPHEPASLRWRLASVRQDAVDRLAKWLDNEHPDDVKRLGHDHLPLATDLQVPEEIGIDRLLAAVAADRIRPAGRPAVVIDLGSAITVDVVSREGKFCGGAILPGIRMWARALNQYTDQLPEVSIADLETAPSPLGTSTDEAIASGLYWGAVGAIRTLVQQLKKEMSAEPFLVLTGGAAAMVVEALGPEVHYEPHLILSGIALLHDDG